MKKILLICFALVSVYAQAQWTLQSSPTSNNLNSVFFPDANTGYAVGDSGTIIKTIDGGNTWNILSRRTTAPLNSVFFTDKNTGYVVGEHLIFKTNDGGNNLTETHYEVNFGTELNSVFFIDSSKGFIVGRSWFESSLSLILKTVDGGATWARSNSTGGGLRSVYFTDSMIGYAVGVGFIKTIDGGDTWTEIWDPIGSWLNSVYFIDQNIGYVVGMENTFLQTCDGFETCNYSTGAARNSKSVYFASTNVGYIVGENDLGAGIILKTINGGSDWTEQQSGTNYPLNSVFFTDANTGYAVGDHGTILKTTNGGGLVSIKEPKTSASTFTIYPNPARNKISITTTSNKSYEQVLISIFSINGQLIQSNKFQNQEKFEMDVSTMQKGIYLLRMQDAAGVETQKLVLQ